MSKPSKGPSYPTPPESATSPQGQGINSPGFKVDSSKPVPTVRAIKDSGQAAQIYTTLTVENRSRNLINARIMAKHNSERPYRQETLEAEGLGWKSNFSSRVLGTLIDKVAPRFTRAIDAIASLTSSMLSDSKPGANDKTAAFRREVTKTIRSWPEWKDFVSELAQENALFGYTAAGWVDEYTWKPKHFRQDRFFAPTGTRQNSNAAQIVCFKENLLPHELFALVKDDVQAAADAGWNVPNVLTSINSAIPETIRSKASDMARVYEDLVREVSVGVSHTGAKIVQLAHVFGQEVTGKVSHYIVDAITKQELFVREDRFESMRDVAVFFTFQKGNHTLHGSKGIGREVYAMAGIIERARNEAVDQLQLSGKIIVQGDDKLFQRYVAHVVGNAMLISSKFEISEKKLEGSVEPFLKLDAFMKSLLDEVAGNISPVPLDQAGEGMRSPAAWNLAASREEESKDMVIERFIGQFTVLVSAIQQKMCSADCTDDDAKAMQKRLLLVMKREELDEMAKQVSAEVVEDLSEQEKQKLLMFCQEHKGDPLFNQKELARRSTTALFDEEFAEAVLMPDNDPTEEAEQSREQTFEILAMQQAGVPIPVSARDNHVIHTQVLQPVIESALQVLTTNPAARPILNAYVAHGLEHVKIADQQKNPAQNVSGFAAFLADVQQRLKRLDAHDAAIAATLKNGAHPVMAANAGATAGATAVPPQGAPGGDDTQPTEESEQAGQPAETPPPAPPA